MPLQPKQLPPYYTPGNIPTGGSGKYLRIHYEAAVNITTGTTETNLFTFTIPANTLINDGDSLVIEFTAVNTVPAENHIIRFYILTDVCGSSTETVIGDSISLVKITKTTSTGINMTYQTWQEGGTSVGKPDMVITGPYDFTTPIAIKFTGQCTGLATIQTFHWTIDKISN